MALGTSSGSILCILSCCIIKLSRGFSMPCHAMLIKQGSGQGHRGEAETARQANPADEPMGGAVGDWRGVRGVPRKGDRIVGPKGEAHPHALCRAMLFSCTRQSATSLLHVNDSICKIHVNYKIYIFI